MGHQRLRRDSRILGGSERFVPRLLRQCNACTERREHAAISGPSAGQLFRAVWAGRPTAQPGLTVHTRNYAAHDRTQGKLCNPWGAGLLCSSSRVPSLNFSVCPSS